MKADIKLPLWIPIIASIVSIVVAVLEFNVVDIIIIVGALSIITYFVLGFVRKRDALIIDNVTISIVTPIKRKEYDLTLIKDLELLDGNSILKCTYPVDDEAKTITLCSNIYTETLESVYEYLIKNNPSLKK